MRSEDKVKIEDKLVEIVLGGGVAPPVLIPQPEPQKFSRVVACVNPDISCHRAHIGRILEPVISSAQIEPVGSLILKVAEPPVGMDPLEQRIEVIHDKRLAPRDDRV